MRGPCGRRAMRHAPSSEPSRSRGASAAAPREADSDARGTSFLARSGGGWRERGPLRCARGDRRGMPAPVGGDVETRVGSGIEIDEGTLGRRKRVSLLAAARVRAARERLASSKETMEAVRVNGKRPYLHRGSVVVRIMPG